MSDHRLELRASPGGYRLIDRRADITPLLRSRPVAQALALIPVLLPVCAKAQRIAAERSVEAAREEAMTATRERCRERELRREQALAAAWRLLVDWPRLAGSAGSASALRDLKVLDDSALAGALRALLPGMASALTVEDLLAWVEESPCVGAAVARRARDVGGDDTGIPRLLRDQALESEARGHLSPDPAWTRRPTTDDAIYVGALAMCRHPLVARVAERRDLSLPAKLVLAMLLDTLAIAAGLADEAASPASDGSPGSARGVGRALTARGPLFHSIVLDDRDRVADWRILAPTDWHVAPNGLLQQLLCAHQGAPELIVGVIDPCAPWRLAREAGEVAANA